MIAQLFKLAQQHQQLGDFSSAEAIYRQILALDPHLSAYYALGELYFTTHFYYQQALQMQPDFALAHKKGGVFEHLKRFEEALACYRQACHFNPENARWCYKVISLLDVRTTG